ALAKHPEHNGYVRRGRFYRRNDVSVFFIAAHQGGHELSGAKVSRAHEKSLIDVAREVEAATLALRAGQGGVLGRAKRLLTALPPRSLRVLLRMGAYLITDLNLPVGRLGLPEDPFGSFMVSSLGMFGIE